MRGLVRESGQIDNPKDAMRVVATTSAVPVKSVELFATPQGIRVLGGAGSGKTQMLIERVEALLEEGVSPDEILVFAVTPVAAAALKRRMRSRLGLVAQDVMVTTTRALAIEILCEEEAYSQNMRPARLLADFEVNFLLEDMKTTGLRPSRLKEMLRFFFRGWTELAEDDSEWLITAEEQELHDLLLDNLRFMQGILEPEISKLALNSLRSSAKLLSRRRVGHVLIDDLQCHNRASQLLAHLLAEKSILANADRNACVEVFDSYPYLLGIEEFLTINPEAECLILKTSYHSPELVATQNALLEESSMDASSKMQPASDEQAVKGQIVQIASETMTEEFSAVATKVRQMLDQGYKPGDLAVVTFHRFWTKQMVLHIRELGVPVQSIGSDVALNGDIRDIKLSLPLQIFTALRLIANPEDAVAWRCWCGFGDHLTNSASFMDLKEIARLLPGEDIGMVRLLRLAETQEIALSVGSEKVLRAYKVALSIFNTCKDLKGLELIEQLTRLVAGDDVAVPAALRELLAEIDDETDAATMVSVAEEKMHFSGMEIKDEAVTVLSPESLCSLSYKALILSGFNDGFLPCRDYFDGTKTPLVKQEKMRANDVRLLYLMISAAREDLVISYFRKIDIENAERLKLKIARIRMEKGQRVCLLTPSDLLNLIKQNTGSCQ